MIIVEDIFDTSQPKPSRLAGSCRIKGFERRTWSTSTRSANVISGVLCNFQAICLSCFMGKAEILHSSQPRTASKRPRPQSGETQTLVAFGSHFLGVLMCFSDMWKLNLREKHGGGIHREISQHRRYSQTHH